MPATSGYDLLIKGGHVIDPANSINGVADVAVSRGSIAEVGTSIDPRKAKRVIDATGLYVTPGLIDIHVHVYHTKEPEGLSVVADHHALASGCTTVVDTGTSGANHFLHFKRTVIDLSKTRIFAYVNIVRSGMIGPYEHDPNEMDPELAAATVLAYPEHCIGIKTAHYWTSQPFDEIHTPWVAVDRAIEAAELCRKPVMYDFYPRPERPYEELLAKMRPGDIHTHVYAAHFPVLDENKRPNAFFAEAQKRGLIFDLGHGGGSFWFRNAIPSIEHGFVVDSISTDLHKGSINGPVFSMLHTMSKMLAIGMSFDDVIAKSTVAPAREINHPELGTLSVGAEADIAILRKESGEYGFYDCAKTRVMGDTMLTCAATIRAGEVVYDEDGRSMPLWSESEESK